MTQKGTAMSDPSEEYAEAAFDNPNMTLGGLRAPWPWERGLQCIRQVTAWSTDDDALRLQCVTDGNETATVTIQVWKPQVLRVCLRPSDAPTRPDVGLLQGEPRSFDARVREEEGQLSFDTGAMRVTLDTRRWRLALYDAAGRLICREHPEDTNLRGWLRALPLGYRRDEGGRLIGSTESFYLAPDEKLYGLGERFMPLNRRGQRVELWNFNTWGASNERAYKNVPLLLSSRGYGLFFHTTHRLRFDLGSGHHSSLSTVVESDDPVMDFFILYGPSLRDVLSHYADLTGHAPVPPRWSFGLWMSRASYQTRQEVEEVARRLRAEDIPCDVIHLDPAWLRPRRQADLIWNEEAFPDPPGFLSRLRDRGFKVCLWIHPWIPRDSEVFPEAAERGYFARHADGSIYLYAPTIPSDAPNPCGIVDFSNPEAAAWYQRLLRRLIDWGVAAFKTDFGEAIPEDAIFHNGMTGREMHNLYPILYNRTVYQALEAARPGQAVVWARSAWAGSQRYPVHWSGDQWCNFPNMACTLWGGLSAGLSGIPFWSHDIGGFMGRPDPELYVRWAQFGLLCSHARCHGTTPREPWAFGEEALRAFRDMARLRYRLIPYLYSYAHVASRSGLPILRPMVLEFQDDPNTHTLDLQYMLGRELLVAPVFEPGTRREVYLPAGMWLDFWTGEELTGGRWIAWEAPLERVPLFLRGDSALPLGPVMAFVGQRPVDPITWRVCVQDRAEFTLHEETEATRVHIQRTSCAIQMTISGPSRGHEFIWHAVPTPHAVLLGDQTLPRLPGPAYDTAGWWQEEGAPWHLWLPSTQTAHIQIRW